MDPKLAELIEEGEAGDEVAAIIRLTSAAAPPPSNVRLVSRFGEIATVRLPRGELAALREDTGVTSVKSGRDLGPDLEVVEEIEDADLSLLPSDLRRPAGLPETGRGVLLCVVDWGFDFTHPDFRNPDGTTRIAALWDQRGGASANRYGYGVIHDRAAIDRALKAPDPFETLGYHCADAAPAGGAHGSHVLSIAGGSERDDGLSGVAPGADLCCVHMGSATQATKAKLGNSVSLLEAVDFCLRVAAGEFGGLTPLPGHPARRPCVINLSMGTHAEQHDGTTLIEQGLDAALRAEPGLAVAQSCGNYRQRKCHASGRLRPNEERRLGWILQDGDGAANELEIWYSARDRLSVQLHTPDGHCAGEAGPGERVDASDDGKRLGTIYNRLNEPNTLDNSIQVFLNKDAPPGEYRVTISGRDVVDGRFHAWIERESLRPRQQSRFRDPDADPSHTTGAICNGLRTIAVGAYDAHDDDLPPAKFSSCGPTRDGRVKPDICAPGVRVLAARSRSRSPDEDQPKLCRMSGTSMASPNVAGAIALMFEAAGRPLRIEETRNLLLSVARPYRPDTFLAASREATLQQVGSGRLDIAAAVENARAVGAKSTRTFVEADPEPPPKIEPKQAEPAVATLAPSEAFDETAARFEALETYPLPESEGEVQAVSDVSDRLQAESSSPELAFAPDTPPIFQTDEDTAMADHPDLIPSEARCESCGDLDREAEAFEIAEAGPPPRSLAAATVDAAETALEDNVAASRPGRFLQTVIEGLGGEAFLEASPARIYDALVLGRDEDLAERLSGLFEVVGLPSQKPTLTPRAGDVLVRRADGGRGQASVLADGALAPAQDLLAEAMVGERAGAGRYARVVEAGRRPHTREAGHARRITDAAGRLPFDQVLLRWREGAYGAGEAEEFADANLSNREYVRWVQSSLNRIMASSLTVDGLYGPRTREVVRAFQRQRGLAVDGIVGPRTEAAIQSALGEGRVTPAVTPAVACAGLPERQTLDRFPFGRAEVPPAHAPRIEAIAGCIVHSFTSATPITTMTLIGHTDAVGDDTPNVGLGRRRAEAVRDQIIAAIRRLGGDPSRVTFTPESRGETQPVPGDAAASRRVEVVAPFAYPRAAPPVQAAEIAIVRDQDNDFVVDGASPVRTFVDMGVWDRAYDGAGDVRNGRAEADNFVGSDRRRFYIRVRDAAATGNFITATWRTLRADGSDDDAPANQDITLTRTGAGSQFFVSKALMLVTDDVDARQPTHSGLSPPLIDAGLRTRGQSNHRLRRGRIDGSVRAEYTPTGGAAVRITLPIFDRNPDARRRIKCRVINYGGHATAAYIADTFRNANDRWNQVGLAVEALATVNRPIPAGVLDGTGQYPGERDNAAEVAALADLIPVTPDNTLTVVYVRLRGALAYATLFRRTRSALGDRYFIFMGIGVDLDTLAHELHHVIYNRADDAVPDQFYTFNTNGPEDLAHRPPDVRSYRRIQDMHVADPDNDPSNDGILNWHKRRRTARFGPAANEVTAGPTDPANTRTGNTLTETF